MSIFAVRNLARSMMPVTTTSSISFAFSFHIFTLLLTPIAPFWRRRVVVMPVFLVLPSGSLLITFPFRLVSSKLLLKVV